MTDRTPPDPTGEWLTENFALDPVWPRPRAAHPDPAPAPGPAEHPRWRWARSVARVAGQAAGYALVVELATADSTCM